MKQQDILQRFVFQDYGIRGEWVRLQESWQTAKSNHLYPLWVQEQLGQMVAAATLLSATIKFEGSLILQAQGEGPLQAVVAQCTQNQEFRGWARYSENPPHSNLLKDMFGEGQLILTIRSDAPEPYQGIVPLQGRQLSDALETYFTQSEQLPTRIWLFANSTHAAGLFLQELPDQKNVQDDWERISMLANTITEEEILSLPAHEMLHRLFHEEQVKLFEAQPCQFKCNCSTEKIESTLFAMQQEALQKILQEQGEIVANCEFCGKQYHFSRADLEKIVLGSDSGQPSSAIH